MDFLDEIVLTGLTVFGRHGVYTHEREEGQDFTIDLRLRLSLDQAAASDDVTDTVHYGELAEKVAAIVAGRADEPDRDARGAHRLGGPRRTSEWRT